jgi:hypothetical protein
MPWTIGYPWVFKCPALGALPLVVRQDGTVGPPYKGEDPSYKPTSWKGFSGRRSQGVFTSGTAPLQGHDQIDVILVVLLFSHDTHQVSRGFLGLASTGTGTITLDPTFGSFTLSKLVSHYVNWFLWWKCLDCLDWNGIFGVQTVDIVSRCATSYLLARPACLWCLI